MTGCEICAALADDEYGYSKFGWPEMDSALPAAAAYLELVADLGSGGSRLLQLKRCPGCGRHYLYRTDYEYLVNGTEDEEFLTRLSDEQAARYLAGRPGEWESGADTLADRHAEVVGPDDQPENG